MLGILVELGRVPTGLYVVTTLQAGRPLGFVGSFLMQVGLEPPVLSVAIAKGREHLAAIRAHGRFAVSVLDADSQALMGVFFKRHEPGRSPFDALEHRPSPGGLPILSGALAWLECRPHGQVDAGDHTIFLGEVADGAVENPDADPLLFFRGAYRGIDRG